MQFRFSRVPPTIQDGIGETCRCEAARAPLLVAATHRQLLKDPKEVQVKLRQPTAVLSFVTSIPRQGSLAVLCHQPKRWTAAY